MTQATAEPETPPDGFPALSRSAPDRMNPEIRKLVIDMLGQAKSEAWKVYSAAPHALDLDDLTSLAYTGLMMAAVRWPLYCAERGFSPGCGQVPCAVYFAPETT